MSCIYYVYTYSGMDFSFLYEGQGFVWNQEKAFSNISKHGVSFEQACQIFLDPLLRILDASRASEQREAAIGMAEGRRTLYVVHVWREDERIRIISAREITASERRTYENRD